MKKLLLLLCLTTLMSCEDSKKDDDGRWVYLDASSQELIGTCAMVVRDYRYSCENDVIKSVDGAKEFIAEKLNKFGVRLTAKQWIEIGLVNCTQKIGRIK